MESGQLSPQKEQEIALKILERAELAQMTRQLKMGLGKVATPKKNSRASPVKLGVPTATLDAARVSPLKRRRSPGNSGGGVVGDPEREKSPTKRVAATPPGSPLGRARRPSIELTAPQTPQARSSGSATGAGTGNGSEEHELGADLLMYLATSPYTSSSRAGSNSRSLSHPQAPQTPSAAVNGGGRIPTTPSVAQTHLRSQGAAASPHSTFKVPGLAAAHHTTPSHSTSNMQFSDIMESPQLSFYMPSSTPRKRRGSTAKNGAANGLGFTNTQNLTVPGTPNFNMGDYVHNLFSPSPRVTSGSFRESKKE
ncbi:LAFA_0G19680g1_1 [Lachancea sp. 'fantastica']|nr:LAFA_0G19680g1_1 [Lachancea sp. 'fantastica']